MNYKRFFGSIVSGKFCSTGVSENFQIGANLNYNSKLVAILNELTDTVDTEFGDLSYADMNIYLDAINGEII